MYWLTLTRLLGNGAPKNFNGCVYYAASLREAHAEKLARANPHVSNSNSGPVIAEGAGTPVLHPQSFANAATNFRV